MASNESAVHPLVGIWEYEKCENFDEFLKSQNMNYLTRKMAIKSKPTITIENTDKNWKIKTKINKMMSLEFTCKEEEEFMDSNQTCFPFVFMFLVITILFKKKRLQLEMPL